MVHLYKTARAKLLLVYKLLILCLLECKHSQVLKTVFILKLGPQVAKINKFEV